MVYNVQGDAYSEGYCAFPNFSDNPYSQYTIEYDLWYEGYNDAREDYREENLNTEDGDY